MIRMRFYNKQSKGIAWVRLLLALSYPFMVIAVAYYLYYSVGIAFIKDFCYDFFIKYPNFVNSRSRTPITIFDVWNKIFGIVPEPEPEPIIVKQPVIVEPESFSCTRFTKKVIRGTGKVVVNILTDEDCVAMLTFTAFIVVAIILV